MTSTQTLANVARPRKWAEVVGQEAEVKLLRRVVEKSWTPPSLIFTGPFGTGKTTLARLTARAILCPNKVDEEPCGTCPSCVAIDDDNHPAYWERDAASFGDVKAIREMKDMLTYSTGYTTRIVCYDESHMISQQGQNALLQTLEEGVKGVVFAFATTDPQKMFPTIRSRSIELNMKLLTVAQINTRLQKVAEEHKITLLPRAAALMASYVRGHMRDALVLLEQLSQMSDEIDEAAVRTYLRLDRLDDVYRLLTEMNVKEGMQLLETLLCEYSMAQLCETMGEVLISAYKLKIGIGGQTQLDEGWMKRVIEARGHAMLDMAEQILSIHTDFATINFGLAALGKVLYAERGTAATKPGYTNGHTNGVSAPAMPAIMRKPGREIVEDGRA